MQVCRPLKEKPDHEEKISHRNYKHRQARLDRTTKNSHVRQAVTTAPSSTGREKRSSHLDSMKTSLRNAHLRFISSWNAGRQKTIEVASAVKQKEK
jgi:hypothetical protein